MRTGCDIFPLLSREVPVEVTAGFGLSAFFKWAGRDGKRKVLGMKRKYFGTDGIRGRTNEAPMTAEMALRVGQAAGAHFLRGDHRHRWWWARIRGFPAI